MVSITLVAVVGDNKIQETLDAFKKCHEQMRFEQTLLLAPKLDYKGYNEFVVMELWKHIDTDFCLLVQNDGYILNGSLWDDEFLNWDYIGAPWPPNIHFTKSGAEVRVGNGGFSLRSKKLLKTPTELGLKFTDKGTGFPHEDGFLCNHYREELETYGIKFAPVEVAARFSTELIVPETVKSFGGHKYL